MCCVNDLLVYGDYTLVLTTLLPYDIQIGCLQWVLVNSSLRVDLRSSWHVLR